MRILVISSLYPPHFLGGYELYCRDRVDDWRAAGEDVRVLTSCFRLPGTADTSEPGIYRELLSGAGYDGGGRARRRERYAVVRQNNAAVARHLVDFQPDVVCYWNMVGFSNHIYELVGKTHSPSVAVVCSDWPNRLPGVTADRRRARRAAAQIVRRGSLGGFQFCVDARMVDRWLFVSESQRARARAAGLDVRDSHVSLAGVRLDLFPAAPAKDWTWSLVYVGRVEPRKGVHNAVSALGLLPAAAHLSVVGAAPDDYELRLRELARAVDAEGRVHRVRQVPQDQVVRAIGNSDALILPFEWPEPSGGVILEAMATGTPVICTGAGGSGEYIKDGVNGLLIPPGSPEAIAAALSRLSTDSSLRSRIRQGGLDTAARFSSQTWSQDVLSHLRQVATATPHR